MYASLNIEIDAMSKEQVSSILIEMDKVYKPLPIIWESNTVGWIHYSDKESIDNLKFYKS